MVVTLRSSTREARAADASAHAPLVDYSSSDEGDGDRGDPTWVPSGPEGFDVSSKSPPGSPMEADETNAPGENVEFNLGAGSFTPKKSRLPRSNARSGHTRGSRRAASPMPTTPPPTAGSESPESPSLSLFENVSWPVRPGSRTRDAASEGGPRRSASTPAPATHASASGTPESIPASTATPFKKSPGVVGDASPFGPESSSAAGSPDPRDRPFRPFEGFETSSQTSTRGLDTSAPEPCHFATPPVTEFSNLSFNLGSGGGRRASGASARRRGSTRGGASPGTSPGRGKVRVEGTPGSREPPRFVGASAFASNEAASFSRGRGPRRTPRRFGSRRLPRGEPADVPDVRGRRAARRAVRGDRRRRVRAGRVRSRLERPETENRANQEDAQEEAERVGARRAVRADAARSIPHGSREGPPPAVHLAAASFSSPPRLRRPRAGGAPAPCEQAAEVRVADAVPAVVADGHPARTRGEREPRPRRARAGLSRRRAPRGGGGRRERLVHVLERFIGPARDAWLGDAAEGGWERGVQSRPVPGGFRELRRGARTHGPRISNGAGSGGGARRLARRRSGRLSRGTRLFRRRRQGRRGVLRQPRRRAADERQRRHATRRAGGGCRR